MGKESDKLVRTACRIAAVGGLIYAIYSIATYSGTYAWAADWEMKHFGSYDVYLTALGVILVLFVTPVIVMGVYFKGRPEDMNAGAMARMTLGATTAQGGEGSKGALVCLVLGLVCVLVAGVSYRLGKAKSQQSITFEPLDLAEHRIPKTNYVELKGWARTDMTVEFSEDTNGNKTVTTYMPMTTKSWQTNEPLVFFLRPHGNVIIANNASYNFSPSTEPFEIKLPGVLFRNDLPGPVRSQYEKHGLKVASPYMVLDTDIRAELDLYWEVALIGAIVGFVLLVVTGLMAYQNWKDARG